MRHTPHPRSGRAFAAATIALVTTGIFAAPAAAAAPRPAAATPHVLFSFAGKPCAGPLFGMIAGAGGVLYGTTSFDLGPDGGCAFSLTPGKSGYTQRTLFRFAGLHGRKPEGVVADAHGDLFGNTTIGGTDNAGVVFELIPGASGSYTERILHNLTGGTDGTQPVGTPVLDAHGDLFGTAALGGVRCSGIGCGTLFELTPSGTSFTFRTVHLFTGPPDGADPEGSGLIPGPHGTLFGTTRSGGTARACGDGGPGGVHGCGTVYQITP